jgi:hypothetical protein
MNPQEGQVGRMTPCSAAMAMGVAQRGQ